MSWDNFLPPLAGSFFGVIGGFIANYALQSYRNSQNKVKWINVIRSEIELCLSILEKDRVQLLPTDRWISAVSSGALKFLEIDIELQSLCLDYYKIYDYNSKANSGDFIGKTWKEIPVYPWHQELEESRKQLLTELRKLKDIAWMNPTWIIKADEAGAYWK